MELIDLLRKQGGQYLRDIMPGGLLSPEIPPEMPTQTLKGLLGFTPVGDAISGYDAIQSAREGNYGEAALNSLGLLPFVPAMGGAITKHTNWPKVDPKLFNDEKVGKAKVSYTVYPESKEVDIASLRVPQAHRGKGYARNAMDELLAEVDAAGYTAKLGASPLDNKTSLSRLVDFYRSLGFEPSGRSINFVGDPEMIRRQK